jgi:hypothetical protein
MIMRMNEMIFIAEWKFWVQEMLASCMRRRERERGKINFTNGRFLHALVMALNRIKCSGKIDISACFRFCKPNLDRDTWLNENNNEWGGRGLFWLRGHSLNSFVPRELLDLSTAAHFTQMEPFCCSSTHSLSLHHPLDIQNENGCRGEKERKR